MSGQRTVTDRLCSLPGCNRPHVARGYCHMHYRRWRKHGDPYMRKCGDTPDDIVDLLAIDTSWWTAHQLAARLDRPLATVRKALHRLRDKGAVTSRLVPAGRTRECEWRAS